MSMEGFLAEIDAELATLERDIKAIRIPNNRDKVQKRIDELRVLRSRAEPPPPKQG